MKNKKTLSLMAILFVSMLIVPLNNILINNNDGNIVKEVIDDDSLIDEKIDSFDFSPKLSDITYHDYKLNVSSWWNKTYRYRIGLELEETDSIDRYQPVDIYLTFLENEHYENSTRLVMYNQTGSDEWSDPIPIQVWNITKYPSTNYFQSCTITFIANVSASSNQSYFLYFNENMDDIEIPDYGTSFSSVLSEGKLTIYGGNETEQYKAVLEQGLGVSELIKSNVNFHTDDSMAPEKQLSQSTLKFLAHLDEGQGTSVSDSTGNVADGSFSGKTAWANGILNYGLEFDGTANTWVSFANELEDTYDPFNDASTEFTITAWIKPTELTTSRSNHYTYNCFMAKASDTYNDNFEVGVNVDGTIHIYLDAETRDTYADYGDAVSNPVMLDEWNFISVRYDSGNVDVRINDVWYNTSTSGTEPWNGATDLDSAADSEFTLGATEHINTYFTGFLDEVAIYNASLTNTEIEEYKLPLSSSKIQTISEILNGEVFSRYQIDWTETFDMHTQDIITFYHDYRSEEHTSELQSH